MSEGFSLTLERTEQRHVEEINAARQVNFGVRKYSILVCNEEKGVVKTIYLRFLGRHVQNFALG